MKLCWDNIENLTISKNGNFKIGNNIFILKENCKKCGHPFLTRKQYESDYCSNSCSQSGENNFNFGKVPVNKRSVVSKEQKEKISNKCADYRKINKEKIKTLSKNYYEKNKKSITKRNFEYKEKNLDRIKTYMSEYISTDKHKEKKKKYNYSSVLWNSDYTDKIKPYEETRQNEEYLEVKCTYCGKWFVPLNWEISVRLQSINGVSEGEHRLYCSDNCKKECSIYNRKKYPKGYKKATSREVQPELRQMVLLRDNYTCQKCGLNQTELKVGLLCHHKEGILWEPLLSADIDMCITYCKTCHKEVHKIEGCKYSDMRC